MSTYSDTTTKERFATLTEELDRLNAVPMLVIGCVVEGEFMKGSVVALNCQGKSQAEMYIFLKEVLANMESQLQ